MLVALVLLACSTRPSPFVGGAEPPEGFAPDGEDTDPPADTAGEPGAVRIEGRITNCTDKTWSFAVDTSPDPGRVVLDLGGDFGAGDRVETHEMELVDAPHWQAVASLGIVADGTQQPGVSTAFPCVLFLPLTWRIQAWDEEGAWSDCRVGGDDPDRWASARCAPW